MIEKTSIELNARQKKECDSVVSLWKASDVQDSGNGESQLQTIKFGDALNLCKEERFREQPIGAFCSGFLVGPDLIVTAGHCIKNSNDLANTRFVFGYRMNSVKRLKLLLVIPIFTKAKKL